MKSIFCFCLLLLFGTSCQRKAVPSQTACVIPQPLHISSDDGYFSLSDSMRVVLVGTDDFDQAQEALGCVFNSLYHAAPSVQDAMQVEQGAFNLVCDPALSSESYRLKINPQGVVITASDAHGAFYGVQTLRQLLIPTPDSCGYVLPFVQIEDAPRLAYRGLMLDVARHFFSVEDVKQIIDIMALHKLNRLHLHLTDDQGWRIEIKRYPRLTEFGSVRLRTIIGKDPNGEYDESTPFDDQPYGGFYTQDDVREILRYAAQHCIEVIPEIEFTGHAVSALASYPWLSCTGEQYEVRQSWDIDDRVYCVGKESTFEFMQNVLLEVMDLFPSPYIHIGGDECPTKMWAKCPHCQALMKREKMSSLRSLQGYATLRIEKFLHEHGRKLIGWDEMLDSGVSPSTVVMSWRGIEGGIKAAQQGNYVVMSPTTYCYFDYYQSQDHTKEPLAWGGYLPLEQVYEFDPFEGLDAQQATYVLGIQANLWSEYIPTLSQAEYMLLPRLAALSEVAWSHSSQDYSDFKNRLQHLCTLYDQAGYVYARSNL